MDIGERLKKLRNKRGFSQYQLSNRAGVSQSFLSSIEAGKKSPTVNTLEKICRGLGISLAEFFSDNSYNLPAHLQKLLNEVRYLTPEQDKLLTEFLISIRKKNTFD
ncbi:MAG: HTH-type transcriptional regulator, repressor for puuD [Halanaerobiales bacterium]|nr:HTH-type transcriptional regulator, repressor for puuD [Halanaerobiales bacterium]